MQREYPGLQYIRILEFQKSGNPHFHILVSAYIPQPWIKKAWIAVGGGEVVHICQFDLHNVSRYLSKYLTKQLLMSAPLRSRRVTTSRSIKLLVKTPSETKWLLIKVPISRLIQVCLGNVTMQVIDEDGFLESFTAILKSE